MVRLGQCPSSLSHGHLGSNQMLKNFGFFNQKMEMLSINKASHCKNETEKWEGGTV